MTSSAQSILEKPLRQLTEEEISLLTREDCRKFLKNKGMRRPSWNKSQAIQQVISLKALLEGKDGDDSDAAKWKSLKRMVVFSASDEPPPCGTSDSPESEKEQSGGGTTDIEEIILFGWKDLGEVGMHGDVGSLPAELAKKAVSPRRVAPEDAFEQMTIFYCGKANVYEKVSTEKAQSIMQFANSPKHLPLDKSFNGSMAWSFSSHVGATGGVVHFPPREMNAQGVPADLEGQLHRKESLQRYREKRKDSVIGRVKFKSRKEMGVSSRGLGILRGQQNNEAMIDRQLGKSTKGSSPPCGFAHGQG
ncbi:hypothetical protein MLD38_016939 [Melastoma candidum]|uniref:Uncharacterized protein n=1 Tax=Melastoma candidum TaxID=119954 RepID=A0ACB9QXA0_9MYRT|nr:hypothetical protein MLD38_016939 [Melastoma candidum]